MVKRVHLYNETTKSILCGTPHLKPHRKPVKNNGNGNYRKLKTTLILSQVTCDKCKMKLVHKSTLYTCPVCKQSTETFLITETVTVKSTVAATDSSHRIKKHTTQRTLVDITCPVCHTIIPMTGAWRKANINLKLPAVYLKH